MGRTGWWDDGCLGYAGLLNVSWFRNTRLWRVNDDRVFLVTWLGSGTVLTFDEINLGLGRTLLRNRVFSRYFGVFVVTRLTLTFKLKVYFRRLTTLMTVVVMMFTMWKFNVNFSVFVFMMMITISFEGGFKASVVMWGVEIEGSRVVFVFVFGSERVRKPKGQLMKKIKR